MDVTRSATADVQNVTFRAELDAKNVSTGSNSVNFMKIYKQSAKIQS